MDVGCDPLQLGVDVACVHHHSVICAWPAVMVATNQRFRTSTDLRSAPPRFCVTLLTSTAGSIRAIYERRVGCVRDGD
jgi:hypothetical protein